MPSFLQTLSQLPLISSLLNLSPTIQIENQNQNQNHNDRPLHPSVQQCPYPPVGSCPFPPPRDINTCCVNHPSGHFLQTQFWDTAPPLGPADSWTIHGLWPDLCNGGFEQFCDSARRHDDIPAVLKAAAPPEVSDPVLAFMAKYWLALDGNHPHLWAHEWNKHGTCISTLEPACYAGNGDGDGGDELDPTAKVNVDVFDYVVQTTSLFKTLDTYAVLADAGILPSHTATYTLRELEDAVESSAHGAPVTFRCNRFGELDEVWYHFTVMGPLRTESGRKDAAVAESPSRQSNSNLISSSPFLNESAVREIFVPTSPTGALSNCPRRGIKYRPKAGEKPRPGPSPTSTDSSPPTATPTSLPFSGKGYLKVHVLPSSSSAAPPAASNEGCLIRLGDWYTSGTCATFNALPDVVDPGHAPLFSLSSSYSPCLIDPATKKFECSKSTSMQSIFSADPRTPSILSYRNSTTFYTTHAPKRYEKVGIYADRGNGERSVELEIHWAPV
ncbi:hypothetical protein A1O3_01997 [Capronia epimyces CBS 606.96]|uniref:Ribonuclease T2-like n=1 Tax=Capronia epimyces CBS 606.96 TaxID=1182542 RepID=W9Y8U4_9EURO|nr:uncharacterized protein A1O3_01997 [Capronia epimyces CBS 606.96]EXJ88933.1 hypothetical protein A1O3_01997 [Capronia epimyces CBS 606.96]